MAMTPTAYATAEEYRERFSGTSESWPSDDQDDSIDDDLEAMARWIDNYCNQTFAKEATAVARVYIARMSGSLLRVDGMAAAPTSVKIDTDNDGLFTDEDAITGFEAFPLDATYGPEAKSYRAVHLPSWASMTTFSEGQRVQVTAQWGCPAVPLAVKTASIELTGILRLQSPRATNRYQEDIAAVIGASSEARSIVTKLLDPYKRGRVVVA